MKVNKGDIMLDLISTHEANVLLAVIVSVFICWTIANIFG